MNLLLAGILLLSASWTVQARPQKLDFALQYPTYHGGFGNTLGKPVSLRNPFNLGGGWSLGKTPGRLPAYGVNYQTGNWKFGAGVNGDFKWKPIGFKPTYGGVGASYTFG